MKFINQLFGGSNENATDAVKYIVYGLIIILLLSTFYFIIHTSTLNNANCKRLEEVYPDKAKISSIPSSVTDYQYNLRDYYIKTAYNCCCGGEFKNDFVNICALQQVLAQGARCLDFAIYSVGGEPVVAASSVGDFTIKETYNSIPFQQALQTVNDYAFSDGHCPNAHDPLILYFRIMSNRPEIYDQMSTAIYNTIEQKLLGKEYSYEYEGKNLGQVPIQSLTNKIIICVDKSNPGFEDTSLDEYINIASNTPYMRAYRVNDVKNSDMEELIDFNKKQMTIVLPDLSADDTNPSSSLMTKYGCQMVGMSFQNFDSNMEYYDEMFDDTGHAFVLKPASLRYVPVTIPVPPPPPNSYSFKQRDVSADYYKFSI